MNRVLASIALAALSLGCSARTPAARPPAPTPPPSEGARAPRIAVVDLTRAMRVHARWPEVTALERQISDLRDKVAVIMGTPPSMVRVEAPRIDLAPEMKAAVERMRPEFEQQAEAVKAAGRKDMDAYVAQLRVEQQKKLEAKRSEIEAELGKSVQAKQQALDKDNQQFRQQTLAEYRLPLLNLKLKIEDVQQSSKAEAEKLNEQIQTLTKERDDKISAHEKANQQALHEFQSQQIQAGNDQMKAYQEQLAKEGQRLVDEHAAKLTEQVRAQLAGTQAAFNQRLRQQEQALVTAANEAQTRQAEKVKSQAQQQAQQQVQGEVAKLKTLEAELQAAERGRARLYNVILADVRIEAATLAQEKGWDVVLTRAIAAPGTIDATDELIARIRR